MNQEPLQREARVTIEDIFAVVDELTIASSPSPRSRILRIPLITELRAAATPDFGSTGSGRGSATRTPINADALERWEDITGRVEALYEDLEGAAPVGGSHEQILTSWSRDVAAADAAARTQQYARGLEETGMDQDALRLMLHRVARIRDEIRAFFDPPASGDIPKAPCPNCGATKAYRHKRRDVEIVTALGWVRDREEGVIVTCRACGAAWVGEAGLIQLTTEARIPGALTALLAELINQSEDDGPGPIHITRGVDSIEPICGAPTPPAEELTAVVSDATCEACITASEKYFRRIAWKQPPSTTESDHA